LQYLQQITELQNVAPSGMRRRVNRNMVTDIPEEPAALLTLSYLPNETVSYPTQFKPPSPPLKDTYILQFHLIHQMKLYHFSTPFTSLNFRFTKIITVTPNYTC
jgi:hypothetical protein